MVLNSQKQIKKNLLQEVKIVNKLGIIVLAFIVVGSYVYSENIDEKDLKITLAIRWQRLVDEKSQTCERCGSTEMELQTAFQGLEKSLAPLGIKVTLEKNALAPKTCVEDISQSNRIWIGERALEEWLGAKVGKSRCGFCCEELSDSVECRAIIFENEVYEIIPAILIIKAGLQAASQMLIVAPDEPCCPKKTPCEIPCGDNPEHGGDLKKHK